MEKIIVNPLEVRGLGNIVSPKSIEDFEVYNSSLSFEDNVYTLEYSPGTVSVALTVSSGSITIGESIVLEAIVTDDGVPLENVSVRFVTGNQVLGTDDTDVNGEASLTVSDLSVGSYSIYASANGQSSSPVSVTVSKLTSTITLSVPSTGTVGTSYTVSGTLVPSSGSVKLYENSVLKDTLTVSNGYFSKAITQSNEGTYSYYAVFEGSSTYSSVTSSTGSIVVSDVPTPTYDGITLTSDKSILSAYDSESATLTAQLMNGSSPALVAGETVTFEVRKESDDSLVETLTGTTNSSGVATVSYLGIGAGDLNIKAECNLLIQTYSIEDCILYDTTTYNLSPNSGIVQLGGISYANTGDWEISYIHNIPSQNCRTLIYPTDDTSKFLGIGIGTTGKERIYNNNDTYDFSTFSYNTDYLISIKRENNSFNVYSNNALLRTCSNSNILSASTLGFGVRNWGNGTGTVRNIKIKPL